MKKQEIKFIDISNEDIDKIWDDHKVGEIDFNHDDACGSFSIVLPPPNVTGTLHMGHALCIAIQDIFARFNRLIGNHVVWVPGIDHAGIATQTVVQSKLISNGIDIKNITKQDLLNAIWDWKENSESQILKQIKYLGASCSWSRYQFTMSEKYTSAVNTAFKILFDKGLIYKSKYIVNWDPINKTALSDDEVEYESRNNLLYYIKYDIHDSDKFLIVATTRPETILGDVALAFNPMDERYVALTNYKAINPITGTLMPIIPDHVVSMDFGTGVIKVTPAHDKVDYEIAIRHNLPIFNVINEDMTICYESDEFYNLSISDAKDKIIKHLQDAGKITSIEDYKNNVAISYRSKGAIQHIVSDQWFFALSSFKEKLIKILENDEITISPKMHKAAYINWITNLHDWCISRQIIWGHQIPIWENILTKDIVCDTDESWITDADRNIWKRDDSVLDTWFSSAIWPFAVFGWPIDTLDLQKFYPIDIMITGHDIIFFWVTKMIVMGMELTGKLPFSKILLHGLLYSKSYWTKDNNGYIEYIKGIEREKLELSNNIPSHVFSKWEKISKSKGNVINPLDLSSKYGVDSVRMGLMYTTYLLPQVDIHLSNFEEAGHFLNKISNVCKLILILLEEHKETILNFEYDADFVCNFIDVDWILQKYSMLIDEIKIDISNMDLHKVLKAVNKFVWLDFCSVFIERSKKAITNNEPQCLVYINICIFIISHSLQLIHIFAPYKTEQIFLTIKQYYELINLLLNKSYAYIKNSKYESLTKERNIFEYECLAISHINSSFNFQSSGYMKFEEILKIVDAIRAIRGEMNIPANILTDVYVVGSEEEIANIQKYESYLQGLIRYNYIFYTENKISNMIFGSRILDNLLEICIPLPQELIAVEEQRLQKEYELLKKNISSLESRINNSEFINKASKDAIDLTIKNLEIFKEKFKIVEDSISKLLFLSK